METEINHITNSSFAGYQRELKGGAREDGKTNKGINKEIGGKNR